MTRAYNELYLGKAQVAMGDMLHFAVYDMRWDIERFYDSFISTGVAYCMYRGEPRLVVGKSGVEIFNEVYYGLTGAECETEASGCFYKSPEYFAGWALAYYSWYRNKSYEEIQRFLPISTAVDMYMPYHEMDVMQFVEAVDKIEKTYNMESRLKRLRVYAGLTQQQLADKSGVSRRMIEQYEQGRKELTHASVATVISLADAMGCNVKDII
ncbi:MAG: helix-turn-helix domain-containing protein [Lachnospiraceae bacterium]|nr:helix-turn-helix domain-containing protein [Lachnospiraceae bacterium]